MPLRRRGLRVVKESEKTLIRRSEENKNKLVSGAQKMAIDAIFNFLKILGVRSFTAFLLKKWLYIFFIEANFKYLYVCVCVCAFSMDDITKNDFSISRK